MEPEAAAMVTVVGVGVVALLVTAMGRSAQPTEEEFAAESKAVKKAALAIVETASLAAEDLATAVELVGEMAAAAAVATAVAKTADGERTTRRGKEA